MPQVIGVPKETAAGEKRVATVPEVVEKLIKLGFKVVVQSGAGDAGEFQRRSLSRRGRRDRRHRGQAVGRIGHRFQGARAQRGRSRPDARRRHAGQLHLAGAEPRAAEAARGEEGHRAGDGQRAAHLARAEAGRALLDGQHRRLPRRHRSGASLRPFLHRPDHGRGQGAAGQGVRHRRRRRGSRRDRHGFGPGRHRARQRHASRSGRSGQIHGRRVRHRGLPGGRHRRRRLRQGDERGLPQGPGRGVRQAGEGSGHHHHHRAHSGQAGAEADHRRHGEVDETGQRHRRPGRGAGRQLRADRAAPGDREARRDHHRLQRSAEPPGQAVEHAVCDQPVPAHRGAVQDQGRRHQRQHGRRSDPRHHGGEGGQHHLAATGAKAFSRTAGSGQAGQRLCPRPRRGTATAGPVRRPRQSR